MPTKKDAVAPRTPRKSFFRSLLPIRFDGYVIVEIAGPFLGGLVFFSFIFLMFQTLRLAEALIEHSVPVMILLKMVGLMIISFLPLALPLAFLIAVLVAFGRLSADSELVAMKANGMSIHRLALPGFVLSAIVAAASLGLNLDWVPTAKFALKGTLLQLTNTKPIATIKEGTFTTGFFDLLVYAEKVDQKTNELEKVFIYDERDPRNPLAIIARAGEIVPVKVESELGASIALRLYDGNIHSNDIQAGTYQKMNFQEYQVYLRVDAGTNTAIGKPTNQPYSVLKSIQKNETDPRRRREFRTEIYKRWMTALAPFLFVLIGIGYGTVRGRAVRSGAALTAILVIVPFYIAQTAFQNWAYTGKIPPFLAMLIPNLFLLVLGIRGYRRTTW